ncbi:5-oxoprolinase [Akanthomyces lecanii RCEF 1005]|uniref:5-oxoprolinase n=1 Tax=Akanthomyces lecanii RCEF 1005 TaxID=1081108 RepID=A0A168KCY5_CORDF|nr:5-oxoprolinase [Akanthomyces lecanii RCEF 1005]
MTVNTLGIRVSIDRGGTFTDVHASIPEREDIILKLLSVDPANYQDAPTEGIRRILELATGQVLPRGEPLDLFHFESIRMGTTVATNALLERKGERVALITTKGFRDLLAIGNQSRPNIFDLSISRPGVLFETVIEIDERVTMENYTEDPESAKTTVNGTDPELVSAITGETVRVLQKPDLVAVQAQLLELKSQGFRSVAVAFIHSYAYPDHELQVGRIALEMGFSVTLSAEVQSMIKIVPRGTSAVVDAYLTPIIRQYIESISANFRGGFSSAATRIEFMQSDGGLADYRKFSGLKAILSGPAGGVVGYAQTSWDEEERCPIIGFDMGGTSTDVSRYAGSYDHVFETTTAGVNTQSPQLDIHTVAAGGGSILTWRNGLFNVGPESASAHPGPACYRKGGPLTITDANLLLGRLLPEYFPKVFGPKENESLNRDIVVAKFSELTININKERTAASLTPFSAEEVALGFLKVANEGMAGPIRALTEARGYDAADHHLACFGGAGGQHACAVAQVLGISRIIMHKYSSILSAYGISLADVVQEIQRPAALTWGPETQRTIQLELQLLADQATHELLKQGFSENQITFDFYLSMRYAGSSSSLMILKGDDWDFQREFEEAHIRGFGFHFPEKAIIIDDFRVRAIGKSQSKSFKTPYSQLRNMSVDGGVAANPVGKNTVYFEGAGHVDTSVYELQNLHLGTRIVGPAMVIDKTQTILISPGATAIILENYVIIDRNVSPVVKETQKEEEFSPIQLSVFAHRFMAIAEQMGRTLRKTSVSTNIKERLDFSCAIFSPDGGLVANAPHVPVHLGSMQFAVQYQHRLWEGKLQEGDVLVSNHPSCGGTHLPDITVITPVFEKGILAFYVASRGHHADIGGILPGSMPPTSTALWQEGAAIESTKLVSGGRFNDEEVRRLLLEEPAKYDGCSGTRRLLDNISDLKAQIAANSKGINLITALIEEFGLPCVHRYMYAIQTTAEEAVRELMRSTLAKHGPQPLVAVDYMDDGTAIKLTVTISNDGSATFDFTGTGSHVLGNTNAPLAITHSAIIYCLRSLVSSSIPLNQGCLSPIKIIVPQDTILRPGSGLAVVGGNVLTSQRVTDVVLKAFQACAASQGCCNNLTFGTGGKDPVNGEHREGFGYYETIAGGAGAGPTWAGQSGVHTHMTNTRITDPEVFEKRYPCILRRFELRAGSGGRGAFKGGDGTVREIEFRVPVQCSILSERRSRQPYGMEGGEGGQTGLNSVLVTDRMSGGKRLVNLGAKATTRLEPGDRVIIQSPGGGGWGIEP